MLAVVATHNNNNSLNDTFADAALAALLGSAGAIVLGGVGSRAGVRAAGGRGGSTSAHVLASVAGWGASLLVINALYSRSDNGNAGVEIGVLVGTHGPVTALLAPKH